MNRLHKALPALFAAAALVACGRAKTDQSASNSAQPAASAETQQSTPANVALTAKGEPKRRDGYWELASVTEQGTPMAKQFLCVGGDSEEKFSVFDQVEMAGGCGKKGFVRTASGWSFEMGCKNPYATTAQKGTISGDFQTGFLVNQTITQNGTTVTGSIHGKWTGQCPAQFKPGDLVGGDGSKIGNMLGH
jgi:hypothetical protein